MGVDTTWVAFAGDVDWQPGQDALAKIAQVLRNSRVVGQDDPAVATSGCTLTATWKPPTLDLDEVEWVEVYSELFGPRADSGLGITHCYWIRVVLGPRVHVPGGDRCVIQSLKPPHDGVLAETEGLFEFAYDVPGYASAPVIEVLSDSDPLDPWGDFVGWWFRSHIEFCFAGVPDLGEESDALLDDLSEETGVQWHGLVMY
jgi:hypothetical protein